MKNNILGLAIIGILTLVFWQACSVISCGNPATEERGNGSEDIENGSGIYLVTKVVDGDTIVIDTGDSIRLLGIDTPERGDFYYSEARDHLAERILMKNVRIEVDVRDTDRYGRLLRHVYLDESWINAEMIEEGYAKIVTYAPDVMHVETFRALQQDAIKNKRGLWAQLEE